jgi:DNA-binding XRE family transcriptional regulator
MLPEDIKRLRAELDCSIGELADAVGVDTRTLLGWEAGDLFPTKRHCDRLEALRREGPNAVPRKPRGKRPAGGLDLLADPRLWTLVRKLLAHPALFAEAEKIAERYDDPAPRG